MEGGVDIGAEVAKAAIGCAVNLVLPGLGSLAVAGIAKATEQGVDLEKEVVDELGKAIAMTKGNPPIPPLAVRKRYRARAKERAIRKALGEKIGLIQLTKAGSTIDDDAGAESTDLRDQQGLGAIAQAQFVAAARPGEVPSGWQEEFAGMLEVVVATGLKDADGGFNWSELVAQGDTSSTPSAAVVVEWSRIVTRMFAARLEANNNLKEFSTQLRRSDEIAAQNALLWRLDQQRVALQVIAGTMALVAFLVLGVDLDLLV